MPSPTRTRSAVTGEAHPDGTHGCDQRVLGARVTVDQVLGGPVWRVCRVPDIWRRRDQPLPGMLGTTHWMTPTEARPLFSTTRSLVVVTGSKVTALNVLSAIG